MIALLAAVGRDGDPLANSLAALRFVVRFLDSDPRCVAAGLALPLERLSLAMRDVLHGAKPELFTPRRKDGEDGKPGAPANQSSTALQGALAAAVHILIRSGHKRDASAAFVVGEAGKMGLAIAKDDVLRWRDEANAKRGPVLRRKLYNDITENLLPHLKGKPADFAKGCARNIIEGIRSRGLG